MERCRVCHYFLTADPGPRNYQARGLMHGHIKWVGQNWNTLLSIFPTQQQNKEKASSLYNWKVLGSVRVTNHLGRLLTQAALLGHDIRPTDTMFLLWSQTRAFYEESAQRHAVVTITSIFRIYLHVDTWFAGNTDQPKSPLVKEQY